jgi:hypothetical protein
MALLTTIDTEVPVVIEANIKSEYLFVFIMMYLFVMSSSQFSALVQRLDLTSDLMNVVNTPLLARGSLFASICA